MSRMAKIAVITVNLVLICFLVYLTIVAKLEGWPRVGEERMNAD